MIEPNNFFVENEIFSEKSGIQNIESQFMKTKKTQNRKL